MTFKRFVYTEEHVDYVRSIAEGRYNEEITEMFNRKFNTNRSVTSIRNLKTKRKIRSNVSTGGFARRKLFTKQQEEFLKENVKGIGNKELTELFNKDFDSNFSVTQVKSWKQRNKLSSELNGRFEKGHETWNKGMKGLVFPGSEKGWFKKGQAPINYKPVGSERVSSDGYVEVKTADPGTWSLKQRLVWEKHYGKIPERYTVVFADGNRMNLDIDNLLCISRSELLRMNRDDLFSDDPYLTRTGLEMVRLNMRITDIEVYGGDRSKFEEYIKIAERRGLTEPTFIARLKRGWSLEDALNRPLHYVPKRERSDSN